MNSYHAERGSPAWVEAWAALAADVGDTEAPAANGESWQYMGTHIASPGGLHHEFRHRCWPKTSVREYRHYPASDASPLAGTADERQQARVMPRQVESWFGAVEKTSPDLAEQLWQDVGLAALEAEGGRISDVNPFDAAGVKPTGGSGGSVTLEARRRAALVAWSAMSHLITLSLACGDGPEILDATYRLSQILAALGAVQPPATDDEPLSAPAAIDRLICALDALTRRTS